MRGKLFFDDFVRFDSGSEGEGDVRRASKD